VFWGRYSGEGHLIGSSRRGCDEHAVSSMASATSSPREPAWSAQTQKTPAACTDRGSGWCGAGRQATSRRGITCSIMTFQIGGEPVLAPLPLITSLSMAPGLAPKEVVLHREGASFRTELRSVGLRRQFATRQMSFDGSDR
jgi:hypothetical protein